MPARLASRRNIELGPGFLLDPEAVTHTFALLAVTGAGKSNAAVRFAEEMFRLGIPFVVIDPKGDWWGMRADGPEWEGLAIPILGGLHADLPLDPSGARLVADLIVRENLSCILDVSEFDTKAEQVRFLTELAQRLYRLHGHDPQPRHLFLEEADEYLPQRVPGDMARCVGAWSKLVKQGRQRGIGLTLISQRSAVVNKDALSQVQTLFALRATLELDRKAIVGWVAEKGAARDEVEGTLNQLANGEVWVISPEWLKVTERRQFGKRRTFDSGATPKLGARRVATLTDVDLDVLGAEMAATIEAAAADDPAKLRAQVDALRLELAEARDVGRYAQANLTTHEDRAEHWQTQAERLAGLVDDLAARVDAAIAEHEAAPMVTPDQVTLLGDVRRALTENLRTVNAILDGAIGDRTAPTALTELRTELAAAGSGTATALAAVPDPPPAGSPAGERPDLADTGTGPTLKSGAWRILAAAVTNWPDALTPKQVGLLAGFKSSGGTFKHYRRDLINAGLMTDTPTGAIFPTEAGMAASDAEPGPPTTTAEVRAQWAPLFKQGARVMLDVLLTERGAWVDRAALGSASGFEPSGGTFKNYTRDLINAGLVDVEGKGARYRAAAVFFPAQRTA